MAEALNQKCTSCQMMLRPQKWNELRDRDVVSKLFNELGPRFAKRPGGYLRILKFGFRVGDNAPMALVELVDRPQQSDPVAVPTTE